VRSTPANGGIAVDLGSGIIMNAGVIAGGDGGDNYRRN
jgi:hypothetical protein